MVCTTRGPNENAVQINNNKVTMELGHNAAQRKVPNNRASACFPAFSPNSPANMDLSNIHITPPKKVITDLAFSILSEECFE